MWPFALGNPEVASEMHAIPLVVWLRPVSNPLDVRRLDQSAIRLHRREAHIVQHNKDDVRRPLRRDWLRVGLPIRDRILNVNVDNTLERTSHDKRLLHRLSVILARCLIRSHHPDWVKLAGMSCAHNLSQETPRAGLRSTCHPQTARENYSPGLAVVELSGVDQHGK